MASTRRARRPKLEPPPRKPVVMARRVSLFSREVIVRLAPVATEVLHGAARTLSEGELSGERYTGSTMLTIDLARTTERVALLYADDSRCRDGARRIALKEARRMAGCELAAPTVDIESRSRGPEVHLSLNVEATRRCPP
jgi:hypothetical protein